MALNPLGPISLVFAGFQAAMGYLRQPQRVKLDTITVDATMSEVHTAEVDVTHFPVEAGPDITDHIRPRLKEYRIEGWISDTTLDQEWYEELIRAVPFAGITLSGISTIKDLVKGATVTRSKTAYDALRVIRDTGKLIDIVTPVNFYTSMAMTSLVVPRGGDVGEAIKFTASFREVRLVTGDIKILPVPQALTKLGAQQKQQATQKLQKLKDSMLFNFAVDAGADPTQVVRRPASR